MYEFYTTTPEDEKDRTPTQPTTATIWGFRRRRVILCLTLVIVVLVATIGGGVGGSLATANARR
jgi:hypothetical protein